MDYREFADFILVVMYRVTWGNVFLFLAASFVVYLLWRMNKSDARFDVADLFIDQRNGKASGSQLIVLVMAGLSVWTVVTLVQKGTSVTELLLGILGIFVVGKTAKEIWGQPAQDVSISSEETRVTPPAQLPSPPPDPTHIPS